MARKRSVTSDMSIDERIASVAAKNPVAALMWPWFITGFDDWGRMTAIPTEIKARIFPINNLITIELIETALNLYFQEGLLVLYEVNGISYMAYLDWFELQRPQFVRPSKHPDPPILCEAVREYLQKCYSWPIRPATPWLKYQRQILKRDGYKCVYCGSNEKLGLDHVFPRSRGGADTPDNLVAACFPCNRKKSSHTPEEANMKIWGWRESE